MNRKRVVFPALILLLFLMPVSAAAGSTGAMEDRTVKARIPVFCTGKNCTETFTYRVKSKSSKLQTVTWEMLQLKDGESGEFEISFYCPGVYRCEVSQEKGADTQTIYDSTIFSVDIYVSEEENGKLAAEPVVYVRGTHEKKDSCSFKNEKELPETEAQNSGSEISGNSKKTDSRAAGVRTGDETEGIREAVLWMGFAGILSILLLAAKCMRGEV